jgi:hypothetical protein
MFVTLLVVCAVGLVVTSAVNLIQRLGRGASLSELVAGRFHEVVSARALLWVAYALAWAINILVFVVLVVKGISLFGSGRSPGAFALVAASGLLAWPAYKVRRLLADKVIYGGSPVAPAVDIGSVNVEQGVEPHEFLRLGSERFPNHIDPRGRTDTGLRWGLLLGGIGTALLLSVVAANLPAGATRPVVGDSAILASLGILWTYVAGSLLLMLLANNRDYTLVPFRVALLLEVVLGSMASVGTLMMGASGQQFLVASVAVFAAVGVRAGADLRVTWAYNRMKRTLDPIAEDIREELSSLDAIPADPNYRLPPLRPDALADRLAQGCRNVEEKGVFVARHFARFLDVVDVRTQDCAMAQLRFLTVRRYVTKTEGEGTYESTRYPPAVPVWNEGLFPLCPPDGFVSWLDPLLLGSEWDEIVVCPPCGGTGQVTETYQEPRKRIDSYTDHNGQTRTTETIEYDTKTRKVTCSTCGGCGRLLHHQILNTQWQRLQPTVTEPEMMLAELVEDAEETTYLHLPLVEGRRLLSEGIRVKAPSSPAGARLVRAARALAAKHQAHAAAVARLHDARIYRSDFRVCGFRTVRMEFGNLAGRVGWFFGRRPEFYFPRLPLSWAAVATGVFLAPLAAALGLGVCAAVVLALR